MALNDEAVFTAANGFIYTNAVGSDAPTPQAIYDFSGDTGIVTPSGWTIIGHTSRDDLPEFGYDGGDTETRGTWQNAALRTVTTDTPVDFVTFNLVQFDASTFELYYGQANVAADATSYALNDSPGGATQAALLIVIVDGVNKIAFHAPKVDLRRNDAISIAADEFGQLPMRATFLKNTGDPLFQWVPGVDSTP